MSSYSQQSSQFHSTMIGFNHDITSGIIPGTLASGIDQRYITSQSRQNIRKKKKSSVAVHSGLDVTSYKSLDRKISLQQVSGQNMGNYSSKMSVGFLGAGLNKKVKQSNKYVSEFKEERNQSGFIVREMAPKNMGGHLGGQIESVDEGISVASSERSNQNRSRRRGQNSQNQPRGGLTPRRGSSSSQSSSRQPAQQFSRLPQKLNKYQNALDQKIDLIRDYSSGLSHPNFINDIHLLSQQIPIYNRNVIWGGQRPSSFVPKKQFRNFIPYVRPDPLKRKEIPMERVNQFQNKLKTADLKEKEKMHQIVDKYLQECKDGKLDINGFTNDVQQTNKSFNSPVRMKDPRAAATEVYVAGQWVQHQVVMKGEIKSIKKDEPNQFQFNVEKVVMGKLYIKSDDKTVAPQGKLLSKENTKEAKKHFKQQAEAQRKLEKEQIKKAQHQVDYFSEKHWGSKKFKNLRAKREIELELEFIKDNKKNPKVEDFFDIGIEDDSGEEDFLAKMDREDALIAQDSGVNRNERFLRRLQPAQPMENKQKIDKIFQVHQMEALKDLKYHYDILTNELDRDDGTMPDKFERIRERQDSQKLYLRYLALVTHVEELIQNVQAVEQQKSGVETEQKYENSDLKILLSQTSNMNAIISAGQFNMHRKDVNDRMGSLAFKMEKVYNLDKKKGPASEVYRYFMKTFQSAFHAK